jgi:hypothetical protein
VHLGQTVGILAEHGQLGLKIGAVISWVIYSWMGGNY